MKSHPKWVHVAGAVVVLAATGAAVGTAAGLYNDGEQGSPPPASTTTVVVSACDLLPDNWEHRDNVIVNPGTRDAVNPWAAGDAAAAAYFDELSRVCVRP